MPYFGAVPALVISMGPQTLVPLVSTQTAFSSPQVDPFCRNKLVSKEGWRLLLLASPGWQPARKAERLPRLRFEEHVIKPGLNPDSANAIEKAVFLSAGQISDVLLSWDALHRSFSFENGQFRPNAVCHASVIEGACPPSGRCMLSSCVVGPKEHPAPRDVLFKGAEGQRQG